MGDTTTSYTPYDYRRVCDECGSLFQRSQLHRKYNWILCDTCDAPGDRIREEEDAAIARQRPFRILPVPNAKPLQPYSPYEWGTEEAILFDFVLQTAPARNPGGPSDVSAAAWAVSYLSDIVAQGTRPAVWLSSATTKIVSLCTYLLSQQYGSPTGVASTAPDPRYGGFNVSGSYVTATTIAAGLAFVKAYKAVGAPEHLNAANRCATFIRHAQCGDIQATKQTVYPHGGSAYHVGGLAASVADSTQLQSNLFNLADTYAVVFLELLGTILTPSATYGDASSTSFFTAPTQATLATMISQLVAFAETGPFDSGNSGAATAGLSTTAPKVTYNAYLSDGTGTGTWGTPTTVPGAVVAMALAAIFAANPADPLASAVATWLLAFTPNAANATPTTNSPQQTLNGDTGIYDPTIAPATALQAAPPFTEATGALYDLAALGVLSPPLSALSAATLRNGREALASGQPFTVFPPNNFALRYPSTLGRAGLSLQPNSGSGVVTPDVVLAAQFGAVFRVLIP